LLLDVVMAQKTAIGESNVSLTTYGAKLVIKLGVF